MTQEGKSGTIDKRSLREVLYSFLARSNGVEIPSEEALIAFLEHEEITNRVMDALRLLTGADHFDFENGAHKFRSGVWETMDRPEEKWLKMDGDSSTGVGLAYDFRLDIPVKSDFTLDETRTDRLSAHFSLNVPGQPLYSRNHTKSEPDFEIFKMVLGMSVNEIRSELLNRRIY